MSGRDQPVQRIAIERLESKRHVQAPYAQVHGGACVARGSSAMSTRRLLAALLLCAAAYMPAAWALDKPRVLVLTDIENEPDNAMSLGAEYPHWEFMMEGDTPSFLGLIDNDVSRRLVE